MTKEKRGRRRTPQSATQDELELIRKFADLVDANFDRVSMPLAIRFDVVLTLFLGYLQEQRGDDEESFVANADMIVDIMQRCRAAKDAKEMDNVLALMASSPSDAKVQ